jgi:hypothetical protein
MPYDFGNRNPEWDKLERKLFFRERMWTLLALLGIFALYPLAVGGWKLVGGKWPREHSQAESGLEAVTLLWAGAIEAADLSDTVQCDRSNRDDSRPTANPPQPSVGGDPAPTEVV